MITESQLTVMKSALRKYGRKNQVIKAIEEFSELSAILSKYACHDIEKDGYDKELHDKIAIEMADARIMWEQLYELILPASTMIRVDKAIESQIHRLEDKIQNDKKP